MPLVTNGILHKTRKKKNPKICIEPQINLNSQSHLEQREQSRRHYITLFQNRPQSHSNRDRHTDRPMKSNRA
jgi:hypothetical protein